MIDRDFIWRCVALHLEMEIALTTFDLHDTCFEVVREPEERGGIQLRKHLLQKLRRVAVVNVGIGIQARKCLCVARIADVRVQSELPGEVKAIALSVRVRFHEVADALFGNEIRKSEKVARGECRRHKQPFRRVEWYG